MTSGGKSGSRSWGPSGAWVCGCSGGASGSGRDGSTFTHAVGIRLSFSRNLEGSDISGRHIVATGRREASRRPAADTGLFLVFDLLAQVTLIANLADLV